MELLSIVEALIFAAPRDGRSVEPEQRAGPHHPGRDTADVVKGGDGEIETAAMELGAGQRQPTVIIRRKPLAPAIEKDSTASVGRHRPRRAVP